MSVTQRNLRQIACFRSRVGDYYSVIHLKYGTTTLQPYHHVPVRVSLSGLSICLHPTLHRVARALQYHPPVARDSCTVRPTTTSAICSTLSRGLSLTWKLCVFAVCRRKLAQHVKHIYAAIGQLRYTATSSNG